MSDADGAEPKPGNPAPKAGTRKNWSWLGALLLLLIAGGVGAGSAYYLFVPALNGRMNELEQRLGTIESTAVTDRDLRFDVNALDTRIGRIEERAERLESAVAAPRQAAQDARVGGLISRLDALENTIPGDLSARLEAVPSRAELDDLVARLTVLENENSGAILRRAAGILALTELSHAAARAQPFAAELEAAAETAPNDSAIRTLREYANEGAPTLSELAAEFPALARNALEAERAGGGEGRVMRMWNRLMSFISIRRIGNVEGNDSAARIARAEAALENENLSGAVMEVSALQGAAAEAFNLWLARAEARLAVDRAIAEVNSRIMQTLAGRNAAPSNP
jgi:hypothetical protein